MLCSGRFLAPTLHSGSIEHVNTSSSRRRLRSSATRALGIALFLLAMRAAAQPTGIISGVVLDAATKAPVPGAVVIAKSPTLLGEQSAVTDESGVFEMTMLTPGTYAIAVQHKAFLPFSPDGLIVRDRRVRVRVQLTAEQRPAPPSEAAAVEFDDSSMTRPAMISGPEPEYTQEAIDRRVQGQMTVKCVVGSDGAVHKCRVTKGVPFMNSAVLAALEQRRYRPAMAHGKAVDVYYTFNVRLTLPQ